MHRIYTCLIACCLILLSYLPGSALYPVAKDQEKLIKQVQHLAQQFRRTLTSEDIKKYFLPFQDTVRYDWHFIPRSRQGMTFHQMNTQQRDLCRQLLQVVMSPEGFEKSGQIISLEKVLRIIEQADERYRDPDNYALLFFGKPEDKVWGWRIEGHHLSLHFTISKDKIYFLPGFMGTNPAEVIQEVPEKGLRVLKDEEVLAFQLIQSFDTIQLNKALIGDRSPGDIVTRNLPALDLKKPAGISYQGMNLVQKQNFLDLIMVYLNRYHITLKNQQMDKLTAAGLDKLHFCWMGRLTPQKGKGAGHYYRIQGDALLIEFDNTQNGANHIHSVVRDLDEDFGMDLFEESFSRNAQKWKGGSTLRSKPIFYEY